MKDQHRGSDFDDFLKDEGIFEEVKELAQKELEVSHPENPLESDNTYNLPEDSSGRLIRFFQWLRHAINP